jgi:hypothetical protein
MIWVIPPGSGPDQRSATPMPKQSEKTERQPVRARKLTIPAPLCTDGLHVLGAPVGAVASQGRLVSNRALPQLRSERDERAPESLLEACGIFGQEIVAGQTANLALKGTPAPGPQHSGGFLNSPVCNACNAVAIAFKGCRTVLAPLLKAIFRISGKGGRSDGR